jgi:hypothetical protein
MPSNDNKTFALRIRCPYGDYDDWILVGGPGQSLERLFATPCQFECPTHGAQAAFPLEGREEQESSVPAKQKIGAAPGGRPTKPRRSSERKRFHAPVVVYGWSKTQGSFHENTTTMMFNQSGALVRLNAPVELGDKLFLVNRFTQEEQEVRVVFKEPALRSGFEIGLAFQNPVPNFWRKTRRGARNQESLKVVVRGKDRNGNPFSQTSRTLDISEDGARLENVAYLTAPGEIIEVKRRWHGKSRFRVAWIGQFGTSESNQIGICTMEGNRLPWKLKPALADARQGARKP